MKFNIYKKVGKIYYKQYLYPTFFNYLSFKDLNSK